METRTKTEYQVFFLMLNPMRYQTEARRCVAISDDPKKLVDWYNSLRVDLYTEESESNFFSGLTTFHKVFKKDSPLEWMNPCSESFIPTVFGHGIVEQWVDEETLRNLKHTNICFFEN